MIAHLTVRDFALIKELQLELRPGFTVVTGETGAGKSILLAAFSLVLGGRATSALVRGGLEEAVVEALCLLEEDSPVLARLRALELPCEDGQLVIRRIISASGRNRAFVNGSPVTTSMLRDLAEDLVDISSQHEHQSLLRADAGRRTLDAFAGLEASVQALGALYAEATASRRDLESLERAAQEREARQEFLRFQVQELQDFAATPGEDEALRAERERLRHAERLVEGASTGLARLYEDDDSAVSRIGEAESRLEQLLRFDGALSPTLDCLAEARVAVEDAAGRLRDYLARLELDPERLELVEERLFKLEHLLRKHGPGLDDLLQRQRDMQQELQALATTDERIAALRSQCAAAQERLARAARDLSAARRRAARRSAEGVEAELKQLGMPHAKFTFSLEPLPEIGPQGGDRVEMLFEPNPGEPARPLRRIASGGELSRVMLAIKRVLAERDPVPTYLYDEVDTGVSGPVAEAIGRLLREGSRGRQTFCITHHPQVAAQADAQLLVSKRVCEGQTQTEVRSLDPAERVEELARMLGGANLTEATREHARELLRLSQKS